MINKLMLVALISVISIAQLAAGGEQRSDLQAMPTYRVEADRFEASERDIKAVCDSAGIQLWRYFSLYEIDPFVVKRGDHGPFFGYNKNDRGELEILLDTRRTFWCQYAYQFSHEFCHLLCGRIQRAPAHMWFEETLAETASLFALRAMARSWKAAPPYPNWQDYSSSLQTYADEVEATRAVRVKQIREQGLGGFYRAHQARLEQECCDRDLNGAMAVVLLRLFEEQPEGWETIRWLNRIEQEEGKTFQQHLGAWEHAVPPRHQPFVQKIATLFSQ